MEPIRVLVIDDSAFMRKMVTQILTSDKRIEVVGVARNGEVGLAKIEELCPDVVTLDVEMPVMDGLATLDEIIDKYALPVVMLSSVTTDGRAKVDQALASGAIDFIEKPSGEISLDINKIKDEIISKIITASRATDIKRDVPSNVVIRRQSNTVVAIGASTGGPRALQRVLTDLGPSFSSPIFIVQHMPKRFTKSLAERLDSLVTQHVKEAIDNEVVQRNTAYIAPGNFHMEIHKIDQKFVIKLTQDPHIHGHRPAVDTLFHSISKLNETNKVAIILTGMGTDGAKGIKQLKKEDLETIIIAEAEESAIINGMPAAAIKTNWVDQIVHLHKIGETVTKLIQ